MAKNTLSGLVKGTPTGILISIAIHAVLIVAGSIWVVVQITQKEEASFEPPPPVEIKTPKLKKPTVKVKKKAKPRPIKRIMSKAVNVVPDVALPNVSGIGTAMGGTPGGFDLVPDISSMSFFGQDDSIAVGNDFVGTFYSYRYNRSGELLYNGRDAWTPLLLEFLEDDWNPYVFSRLYRSSKKLYATQFVVPAVMTSQGPEQFGVELKDFDPIDWFVHYKGKISHKEGGRFRFWGVGDHLIVRVNGEIVFMDFFNTERIDRIPRSIWPKFTEGELEQDKNGRQDWRLVSRDSQRGGVWIGEWFELDPGEPVEMELLTGEGGGAYFTCVLLVEKDGVTYDKNEYGMPILPIFKTAGLSTSIKNQIKYKTIRGEMDLESELLFNVY